MAGKITDENGKGIPFARVQVKGSSRYVIADAYGVYSINVNPETEVLELIAAGYSNKIFILHGLTTYNFTLSPEACKNMRIMAGKMIQKPVVDDSIKSGTEKEDTSKMIAATEGMLPQIKGSQINLFNKYNQKTNETRVVVLGGMRSIKDTKQPLLVVDSVQLPISYLGTLNPNDIKSIDIMKGSSVYALYGTDASNGVIVVTTKNNKAEVALKKAKDSVLNRSMNKIAGKIGFLVKPVTIKIYPNPVSKGSAFFVSLKQQQSKELTIPGFRCNGENFA